MNGIELDARIVTACATIRSQPQVVDFKDGEMAEWLKEHAWKTNQARLTWWC
jgi:hypothetical protein